MPRLVDGDNLLGSWPGRKRSLPERRSLARETARLALREGRRIVLVFDGSDPAPIAGRGDVLYSGPGKTADQTILALLRDETDRAGWTVITNDRSLADQCRWLGAKVERCDVFRKRLASSPTEEKPAREEDTEYWLDVFGDE